MWLQRPVPPEQRNFLYRGFNRIYAGLENLYVALVGRMVRVSPLMVLVALVVSGLGLWGISRLPTAFIPNEDQGYVLVGVQLPDGALLERTVSTLLLASKIAEDTPEVDQVIAIAGASILDDSSTLANAGLAYVVFKDWSARRKVKRTVTSTATITR